MGADSSSKIMLVVVTVTVLMVKYATDVPNTRSFERSVLSEMVCHHVSVMSTGLEFGPRLIAPRSPTQRMLSALAVDFGPARTYMTSATARFNAFGQCHSKDVVFVKDGDSYIAGEVWHHVSVDDTLIAVLSLWEHIDTQEALYADWRMKSVPCYVDMDDIIDVAIWTEVRSGVARTLLPPSITV